VIFTPPSVRFEDLAQNAPSCAPQRQNAPAGHGDG
jgi:hypothetical protein